MRIGDCRRVPSAGFIAGVVGMGVLGVFLLGCVSPVATQAAEQLQIELDEVAFEAYEINTGTARRQTVLSGFFLGGEVADLAVVNIDENGDCHVRIHAFDENTWTQVIDAALGPDVLFVDVARIGDHDCLVTYTNGQFNRFDPESVTQRKLVDIAASFKAMGDGDVPLVDVTRDLNRDGRDDLVFPDVDGFWISMQKSDNSFTDAVKLGPAEPYIDEVTFDDRRSYGEMGITAMTIPWYLGRVHAMDHDRDGRSDLVFWNEDHFDVYHQNERGQFDLQPATFTTDVSFDADGAYSLLFGHSEKSAFSLILGFSAKTRRTLLHSFADVNGDGIADMVIQTLEGRTILRQRSVFEIHFGTPVPGGTQFVQEVDTVIRPHGIAGGMQASGYAYQRFEDLDGDGQVDVFFRDVAVGFGGMTRAMVGNSVAIDVEFYRMEDGVYPVEPTTTRKIRRFDPLAGSGNVFFPAVLVGDVNGDGRSDLVVGQSPSELQIYLGAPGPEMLARKPQKVAVTLPYDERNIVLADLNKDGKQDLVVHRAPTDHGSGEPHRVTFLVTR